VFTFTFGKSSKVDLWIEGKDKLTVTWTVCLWGRRWHRNLFSISKVYAFCF